MKRIIYTILMTLLLIPIITGDTEAAVKIIKISGKLTKVNRDVKIAAGPGHALASWNQSSPKTQTYGKIFAVELKRNNDGSYTPLGEPFVVFAKGQRPQVLYLPNIGQYILVCDTGPKNPWDSTADRKPTKILARTYIPESSTEKSNMAPGLGKTTTILDDGSVSLYPFIKHIGFDTEMAYEEVLLLTPQIVLKNTANKGFNPAVSDTEVYRTRGMRIDVFKDEMYFTPALFFLSGFMIFSYALLVHPNNLIASFLLVTLSNSQYFVYSNLILMNVLGWTNFIVLPLGNPILLSLLVAIAIAPLFPPAKQFSASENEKASSLNVVAIHNNTKDGEPEVLSFKVDGKIKTNKNFGPIRKTGKKIDHWRLLSFNPRDTSPAAKLSATYVIFHSTDGFVRHLGLSLTGKPTGNASKDFKVKKKLFGGMDTAAFEDEVLLAYVEYTNKKQNKSVIKFTNYEK